MSKLEFIEQTYHKYPQLILDDVNLLLESEIECVFEDKYIPVFLYDKTSDDINIPLSDMSDDYAMEPYDSPDHGFFSIRIEGPGAAIVRFLFVEYKYTLYDDTPPPSFQLLKDVDKLKEYLLKENVDLSFLKIEYKPHYDREVVMIIEISIKGKTLDEIDDKARLFNQFLESYRKYEY
jgi:hypothetical protein